MRNYWFHFNVGCYNEYHKAAFLALVSKQILHFTHLKTGVKRSAETLYGFLQNIINLAMGSVQVNNGQLIKGECLTQDSFSLYVIIICEHK